MPSLKEIKSAIFQTEYQELICDGLCCSEPILTIENGRLIDNYFIYACNKTGTTFSKPMFIFGIDSENKTGVYVNTDIPIEDKEYALQSDMNKDDMLAAYDKYVELYPKVREFAFKECSPEQKQWLYTYLKCLKVISGEILWIFYKYMAPSFFEWAETQSN